MLGKGIIKNYSGCLQRLLTKPDYPKTASLQRSRQQVKRLSSKTPTDSAADTTEQLPCSGIVVDILCPGKRCSTTGASVNRQAIAKNVQKIGFKKTAIINDRGEVFKVFQVCNQQPENSGAGKSFRQESINELTGIARIANFRKIGPDTGIYADRLSTLHGGQTFFDLQGKADAGKRFQSGSKPLFTRFAIPGNGSDLTQFSG